ncbi:hypothetical protein SU60_12305 [Vibrio mytili]|uniref:Uncharacterized protein n=1 Tax=Vibrio mytili TaxID=50718 RepID=A0A0C3I6M8_9VIBR|nr:hypothetical protein SU60_12305 [Vibrio mytili]
MLRTGALWRHLLIKKTAIMYQILAKNLEICDRLQSFSVNFTLRRPIPIQSNKKIMLFYVQFTLTIGGKMG